MDFRVNYGPWETIFSGVFYSHEVEVVMNPEKYFLTIVYEKKDGEKTGALVDGHKALVARGQIDSFIQTLPKKCFGVSKTNGTRNSKMLFISTEAIFVDFKQDDFVRDIDNLIKKSFDTIGTIIELAKSSSLELRETSMSPEAEYAPILGDPFMARSLLSGLKKTAMELIDLGDTKIGKRYYNKIQIGLGKNREIIKEDLENLERTQIIGNKNETNYATYILTENFLLENTQAIIFDSEEYFSGLGIASKNEKELSDDLVDYEPAGFPIKKFVAKENVKIPFSNIDLKLFFDKMKVADKKLEKIFDKKVDAGTPEEFLEEIKGFEELNEFEKLKLERIIKIISSNLKGLFGKESNIEEILKKWPGSLGRATIIDTSKLNDKEKMYFVIGLMREIEKQKKEKEVVIVLPSAGELARESQGKIEEEILSLENKGYGFILASNKSLKKTEGTNSATINIVSGKDVAISIKNKKNYRAKLRASLSGEAKI
jgi:hypothetical protein